MDNNNQADPAPLGLRGFAMTTVLPIGAPRKA
jgi:succinate-acetate transporter protein